uniref:Bulb-type lectin domain-containing protein n=1 Tax=Salix viminalis TaxID=40686 RepID=A0A6N2MPC7_SALVM
MFFAYHRTCFSIGVHTISVGRSLSGSQTLVSQNGIFELGFFVPGTSYNIYLGIWYRNFANKTIVWVANRESPSNDPDSSKLELLSHGNLVLLKNPTERVWSTALASSMPNTTKAEAEKKSRQANWKVVKLHGGTAGEQELKMA